MTPAEPPRVALRPGPLLVAELPTPLRCLSSAVLGGGLGSIRTWACLQVPADYARTDPARHLREVTYDLATPVVGMLTAVDVIGYAERTAGGARVLATVGTGHALAAAGRRPATPPAAGTINILVLAGEPLTDAGLVNAASTAVEAKCQALREAGVRAANADGDATGTATDALCVACPRGEGSPFAGPATPVGSGIARAVHAAVTAGLAAERRRREGTCATS